MIEKLRKVWVKSRWVIISVVAAAVLAAAVVLGVGRRSSTREMLGWLFKKQVTILDKEAERLRANVDANDGKVEELDKKIEKLKEDHKKEATDISIMNLRELNDAWKSMGG